MLYEWITYEELINCHDIDKGQVEKMWGYQTDIEDFREAVGTNMLIAGREIDIRNMCDYVSRLKEAVGTEFEEGSHWNCTTEFNTLLAGLSSLYSELDTYGRTVGNCAGTIRGYAGEYNLAIRELNEQCPSAGGPVPEDF